MLVLVVVVLLLWSGEMKYARIIDGMAHEVVIVPTGMSIEQMFHSSLVGNFTEVPDHVGVRWTINAQGEWSAPLASLDSESDDSSNVANESAP